MLHKTPYKFISKKVSTTHCSSYFNIKLFVQQIKLTMTLRIYDGDEFHSRLKSATTMLWSEARSSTWVTCCNGCAPRKEAEAKT